MNLQETIRKVLREETRGQKKLISLIDEVGLYEASKMLGISITRIVQLSNLPINSELANDILIENIKNNDLPTRYNEFMIDYNGAEGLYNVGTERKTIYELAQRTNKNVKKIVSPPHVPKNISMNVSKMENFLKHFTEHTPF